MIKYFTLLFLLVYSQGLALSPAILGGLAISDTAATYVCLGYEGATCTLSSTPPGAYSGGADASFARSFTATENGTLHRIAIYFTNTWAVAAQKVVVYDASNNLIATGDIVRSASSWVWSSELVAEAGYSLDFSTDDVLYFGISVDATSTYTIGRTDNSGNQWNIGSNYLPDPVSWTAYNHNLAAQVEYAQR